jgi:hypothetical protein
MVVANSDTDGIFDREFFRGEPDPVSSARHVVYWNEEFRATLRGHMTLLNLKRLVEPIMTASRTRPIGGMSRPMPILPTMYTCRADT